MRWNRIIVSIMLGLPTVAWPAGIELKVISKQMKFDCPHPTPGSTTLERLVWNSAETLAVLNYDSMLDANMAGQFDGTWNYELKSGLTGTLTVNKYNAIDTDAACGHGADIDMLLHLTAGLPAGQEFQWIQVYSERGASGNGSFKGDPGAGETIPGIDENGKPFNHVADRRPFYHDIGEVFKDANGDYLFDDMPTDEIDDADVPHSGGVSFMTLLVSWNGVYNAAGMNDVNVYGGLEWGYNFECHEPIGGPAPSTVAGVFVAMCLVVLRRQAAAE